jgi:hypothetical protein
LQVDVSAVDNIGYDFGLSELISDWGLGFVNAGDRRHSLLRKHSSPVYRKVGYTAVAIATGRGQRPVVSVLLENGALVNTCSYHGTRAMSHAAKCLRRAQKRSKEDVRSDS